MDKLLSVTHFLALCPSDPRTPRAVVDVHARTPARPHARTPIASRARSGRVVLVRAVAIVRLPLSS